MANRTDGKVKMAAGSKGGTKEATQSNSQQSKTKVTEKGTHGWDTTAGPQQQQRTKHPNRTRDPNTPKQHGRQTQAVTSLLKLTNLTSSACLMYIIEKEGGQWECSRA